MNWRYVPQGRFVLIRYAHEYGFDVGEIARGVVVAAGASSSYAVDSVVAYRCGLPAPNPTDGDMFVHEDDIVAIVVEP